MNVEKVRNANASPLRWCVKVGDQFLGRYDIYGALTKVPKEFRYCFTDRDIADRCAEHFAGEVIPDV